MEPQESPYWMAFLLVGGPCGVILSLLALEMAPGDSVSAGPGAVKFAVAVGVVAATVLTVVVGLAARAHYDSGGGGDDCGDPGDLIDSGD